VLKYAIRDGEIYIEVYWRNLSTCIYIYVCENKTKRLDQEIAFRGISPNVPIAIIPISLVESALQILQGALHYKIYSDRVKRVRNQGLFLASLVVGQRQLSGLINSMSLKINAGENYYIVGVGVKPPNTERCSGLTGLSTGTVSLKALVKNIKLVLSIV